MSLSYIAHLKPFQRYLAHRGLALYLSHFSRERPLQESQLTSGSNDKLGRVDEL